ncbi:hypothetical protein CXG81DRAFT_14211 [Caulochytrium protostelioides]|uniref:OsmC-like protein n=1 Tax=Caulochytrium protostelioides TaxID=1555241 RepID=A0A4V1IU84_9FUNG|nr:OsmC-like protein [Caulochytrium protostelioides]RKO99668.1 hypothetical protein CXG81DRAFT_14211 [Caulochytrium protostelioides]|eukprot:RKO99668.1 hypothetical protein CXG81DRAFT_14211 [Caulochytrium protostelioides]
MPKALGGPGNADGSVNPEILFASGYAACFIGALGVAAKNLKLKLPKDTQVTAHVTLGTPDLKLSAVLEGRFPGLSREEGEQLMAKGHEICPYSNATRNNCPVELKVV